MLKDLLQKTVLVVGSFVIIFLICEAGFKLMAWIQPNEAGPSLILGLPYENTRNASFWRFDREAGFHHYIHNAFGMRGNPVDLKKPNGTLRLAFLGDSVMHGGNVDQGQTTADYVQKFLAKTNNQKVEALNFGVSSYSLREYSILVKEKVFNFSPDIVLIGITLNDYLIRSHQNLIDEDKSSKKNKRREFFVNLRKSHFLEFLSQSLNGVIARFSNQSNPDNASLKKLSQIKYLSDSEKEILKNYAYKQRIPLAKYLDGVISYIGVYRDPASWQANESFVSDIVKECNLRKVPVYFFCYPTSEQMLAGYENRMPQEFLGPWLRSHGAEYIELLDAFRAFTRSNPAKPIFPRYDNLHFFSEGHQLAARLITEKLHTQSISRKP